MSNVLDQQKQQQVLGLGRLGWPVQRIAEATGVDRATARGYLLAAGIPVRARGRPGERAAKLAISIAVSTDSTLANPASGGRGVHRRGESGAHACAECQRVRTVS